MAHSDAQGVVGSIRRVQQHSSMEIDREMFSAVILSLPLIQEGTLSDSGERVCTNIGKLCRGPSLSRKKCG